MRTLRVSRSGIQAVGAIALRIGRWNHLKSSVRRVRASSVPPVPSRSEWRISFAPEAPGVASDRCALGASMSTHWVTSGRDRLSQAAQASAAPATLCVSPRRGRDPDASHGDDQEADQPEPASRLGEVVGETLDHSDQDRCNAEHQATKPGDAARSAFHPLTDSVGRPDATRPRSASTRSSAAPGDGVTRVLAPGRCCTRCDRTSRGDAEEPAPARLTSPHSWFVSPTRSVRGAREAFNAAWKAYNQAVIAEPVTERLTPAQQSAWLLLVQKQHELFIALRAAGGSPLRESDPPIRTQSRHEEAKAPTAE